MNDQAITSLIKVLLNGSDASYRLKRKIHHALDPDYVSILWHVSEVEHIAAMDEEAREEPIGSIYDRTRFRVAGGCLRRLRVWSNCRDNRTGSWLLQTGR